MMYAHAPMCDNQSFLSNFVIEINGFLISCTFERVSHDKQLDKNEMITSTRSSMMIFKADDRSDCTDNIFNISTSPLSIMPDTLPDVTMQNILYAYTWCAEFKHKTL